MVALMEKKKLLLEQAQTLHKQGLAIHEEYEGKDMPSDKREQMSNLFDEAINKIEESKAMDKGDLLNSTLYKADPSNRLPMQGGVTGDVDDIGDEYNAFQNILLGEMGTKSFKGQVPKKVFRQVRKALKSADPRGELKALQMNLNDQGGYLVPLQQFVAELVQKVHDQVFMEQYGRVFTVDRAQSLGAPSLDATFNDADWSSDVALVNEDTALKTGKRELYPTQVTKLVKISRLLLRQAAYDPDELIRDELTYKFAITKEKGFMTGTGANQPLGLFTASASGISTGRDITATNSTKVISDDFISAKMNLKAGYWNRPSTRWVLHRLVLKSLMTEKATTGNYIFMMTGVTGATPATILDVPYTLSEYAPSTLTTGLYVAIIGDMSFYWIANAMEFEIQVLNELFAQNNLVGYIGRLWSDGMPVLEEAFTRIKLA
jgi:HK97 family phage major capsid protein